MDPAIRLTEFGLAVEAGHRLPVLLVPVLLGFNPAVSLHNDDAAEHEGVSFRMLWRDQVARTIWLGHKPFMLTSQYFRKGCIDQAKRLREWPELLLGERVNVNPEDRWSSDDSSFFAIGAQLVPYLIWALAKQGHWPYWRPGKLRELSWEMRREAV